MDSNTFNGLIGLLQKKNFDDDKADAIKTTVQAAQSVSASQMVQLLKFLSFDDTKLEVAKMAYRYTTDPGSYGNTVRGIFSFSDTKEQLNEHIRQNPHQPRQQPTVHVHHFYH